MQTGTPLSEQGATPMSAEITMTSKELDKSQDALIQEILRNGLAVEQAILGDGFYDGKQSAEEAKEFQRGFWREFVYPGVERIFFELFPSLKTASATRLPPDLVLAYNRFFILAFAEWIKRNGFVPFFNGSIVLVAPQASDLASAMTDGVPVKSFSPHESAAILGRVALYSTRIQPRSSFFVEGLVVVVIVLVLCLVRALS